MGGVTGWHFAITHHERYAPMLPNYCASPVGLVLFLQPQVLLHQTYFLLMMTEHISFPRVTSSLK